MAGKKKTLDLSPLNYFVDIPQETQTPPQAPDAPSEAVKQPERPTPAPAREKPAQAARKAPERAESAKQTRPGRPAVERENRSKIFSICMTPALYEDLRLLAELHGVSVNSYIVGQLGERVEQNRDAVDQIKAVKKKFNQSTR